MTTTITKRIEFDAAHRVFKHEGQCASLHGHRYAVELTCTADDLDAVGRVVDFSVIKDVVGSWIKDKLDHTTIVCMEDKALIDFCTGEHMRGKRAPFILAGEPTAENIARLIYDTATELLSSVVGLKVLHVSVWETPTSRAGYSAPAQPATKG